MTVTLERCRCIVDDLRGTPKYLNQVCTDEESQAPEVNEAVDAELFECSVCGWWCDWDEESQQERHLGNNVCTDCEDDWHD